MADYIPKFAPGSAVTFAASAGVTGGRLVVASGNRTIAPAGADAVNVLGVAGQDALTGESVVVFLRPSGVHALIANGAIAAGAKVISAATGKVATIGAGTNAIGIALEPATNDGDVVDVLFI